MKYLALVKKSIGEKTEIEKTALTNFEREE